MGANSRLGTYSNKYGIQRNMVPNLRFRQFDYVVCLRSVWLNVSVIKVINFAINKQSNHAFVHLTTKILSGNVDNRTNKLLFLYIKVLL